MFEKVRKFYNLGIYKDEQVAAFVEEGKLTAEQREEITGKAYGAKRCMGSRYP